MPNALVDLPLPWPVSTMSSGRSRGLRRLRLGAAEVGGGVHGHAALLRAVTGSRRAPAAAASAPASPTRTGPSSPSKTTTPAAARASRPAAASAASRSVARPSVTTTASARRVGSRRASRRISRSAAARPAASGVAPPVGTRARTAAARSTLAVGGRTISAPAAAEGDERDAVAALVGVGEQAEDRALHARHAPPRAHRARGVDAEDDERALAARAQVLAEVAGGERGTGGVDRAARGGGAQRRGEREVGDRAGRRAAVDGLRAGRRRRGRGDRPRRGRRRRA